MLNKSKLGKILMCASIGLFLAGGSTIVSSQTANAHNLNNTWDMNDDSFDSESKPTEAHNSDNERDMADDSFDSDGETTLADRLIPTGKQCMNIPYLLRAKKGATNQFDGSSLMKLLQLFLQKA